MANTLTQDRLKYLLRYDALTGEFVWLVSTNGRIKIGDVAGHTNIDGYLRISVDSREYSAHRLAWLYANGDWPKSEIDHRDGNPANNRLSNLRQATRSENNQNRHKPHKGNISGFLGVTWNKNNRKWSAQIRVNCRLVHLGLFDSPELASKAYLSMKKELHPFANINNGATK